VEIIITTDQEADLVLVIDQEEVVVKVDIKGTVIIIEDKALTEVDLKENISEEALIEDIIKHPLNSLVEQEEEKIQGTEEEDLEVDEIIKNSILLLLASYKVG
jgi:hypothetical protein